MDALSSAVNAPSEGLAPRQRLAVEKLLRNFFLPLGYTDDAALDELMTTLFADMPTRMDADLALRYVRRRLDRWTLVATNALELGQTVDVYTRRTALLNLQIGRHWPRALLYPSAPAALHSALRAALPLSLPPDEPVN